MSYIVRFTDRNKPEITVFDNISNTDTSLAFPGRNQPGYGQIIAENFLHLLENFASDDEPINPIEGQLWYDASTGSLQIWDNTTWKPASGVRQSPTQPSVEAASIGELWVDTTNQQLRIFTGNRWVLVGPQISSIDGLRYGPVVEKIVDTDNLDKNVIIFYVADIPIIIFSKDTFRPKIGIPGFTLIRSGINVNAPVAGDADDFLGGLLPKLYGTATSADSLTIGDIEIPAGRFLRSDTVNTTAFGINVRSIDGISLGTDSTFKLSAVQGSSRLYNSFDGGTLDFQVNNNGIPDTVISISRSSVDINQTLDISGNSTISGILEVTNTRDSDNLNIGSIVTSGGVAISKNLRVGKELYVVNGLTRTQSIHPNLTDTYDLGIPLKRWNAVYAKTINADTISGTLAGDLAGNAVSATGLAAPVTVNITGDVLGRNKDNPERPIQFQYSDDLIEIDTILTANIIAGKEEPSPAVSRKNDFILTYRASAANDISQGLLKQSRDNFIGDLGVPLGTIMPYAGRFAPAGYLFCDGSEIERVRYPDLYDVVGITYNGDQPLAGINTFRLPDLRGRFPLGRDNMDNDFTVPSKTGGFIDAGGGVANRVRDTQANQLGGNAGQNSVILTLGNLPDHTHNLQNGNVQYSVIRIDTAINPPASTGSGPTAPGQAQYLNNSGTISKPNPGFTFGNPVGLMNPYLTINYIIRSGPPAFTTA